MRKSPTENAHWQFAVYSLLVPVLILYTLVLLGCLPILKDIFLISIARGRSGDMEVRVGYFAICAGYGTTISCAQTSGKTLEQLRAKFELDVLGNGSLLHPSDAGDLRKLLTLALALQSKYFLSLLVAAGVMFIVSVIGLIGLKLVLRSALRGRITDVVAVTRMTILGTAWTSLIWSLVVAAATNRTSTALRYVTSGAYRDAMPIVAGSTLQGLQWAIVGLTGCFALGLSIIFAFEVGVLYVAPSRYKQGYEQPSQQGYCTQESA